MVAHKIASDATNALDKIKLEAEMLGDERSSRFNQKFRAIENTKTLFQKFEKRN